MIDSISQLLNEYCTEILTAIVAFFVGIISHLGKLLISSYLAKRDKLADKRMATTEKFYENVYHIEYLITEYFKEYSDLETSSSGLGLDGTKQSVSETFEKLRVEKYLYETYLPEETKIIYEELIKSIQDEYDGSYQAHGQWSEDNDVAPLLHAERELRAIQGHVKECLNKNFDCKNL